MKPSERLSFIVKSSADPRDPETTTRKFDASCMGFFTSAMELSSGQLNSHSHALRIVMIAFLSALFSLSMISMTAAKHAGKQDRVSSDHKTFHFEFVTVTLLQEASKLLVALCCFHQELRAEVKQPCMHPSELQALLPDQQSDDSQVDDSHLLAHAGIPERNVFRLRNFLRFGVPGLLYCLDNNFQYVILGFLQPAELAVLWNFKILATVVLLRVFLQRRYTWDQWISMLALALGCALTQAHELPAAAPSRATGGQPSSKLIGAGLAIVGSTVAASSNVYCEWLVKLHPEDSIHFQNMQLYAFGIAINGLTLALKAYVEPDSPMHGKRGFFTGYNSWVWLIVVLGVITGITISFALKFVDNVAVVFAHAISVLVGSVVSAEFFDFQLSGPFMCGGTLMLVALLAFHSAEVREGRASVSGGTSGIATSESSRLGCSSARRRR